MTEGDPDTSRAGGGGGGGGDDRGDGGGGGRRGRRGPYAKSAERRTAIVEAAFEVFAAHGYQGGSLQRVADLVGMSQTSLLHYFPSKSDLLLEVLRRRDQMSSGDVERGTDADDAAADDTGAREAGSRGTGEHLAGDVERQARYNEGVPGLIGLYTVLSGEAVTEGNPGRDYVTRRLADLRRDYATDFRALADAGRLRDGVDPDRAAAGLVGLWDGVQLQWLLAPDEVDVPRLLRDYLDLVILPAAANVRAEPGLAAEPAPPSPEK
jgi:AcrR family transcriptional regulator